MSRLMRTSLLALLVLTLVALPAGGALVARTTTFALTTTAIAVGNGYQLTLRAERGRTRSPMLTLRLVKRSGMVAQEHDFRFDLRGRQFSCTRSLAGCTLHSGTAMGKYGRVDLTFRPASPARNVATTCNGSTRRRSGTVSGSLTLKANDGFFGTIKKTSSSLRPLRASAIRSSHDWCAEPPPKCATTSFYSADSRTSFSLEAANSGRRAEAGLATVDDRSRTAPAWVGHLMFLRSVPSGSYSIATDLSSLRFDSAGLASFSGRLDFKADGAAVSSPDECGAARQADGRISGDLRANFNSVGRQSVSSGAAARLLRDP